MEEEDPVPQEQRCNRHDGRGWRCKRPVLDGKSLCQIHYVQGRLRSSKKKVPDSLKLLRPKMNSGNNRKAPGSSLSTEEDGDNGGARVKARTRKRKRSDGVEADDPTEKKVKTKAEELLRVFARREIQRNKVRTGKKNTKSEKKEKEKEKKKKASNVDLGEEEQSHEEVTRELPYGRMAISPPPSANAPSASLIANAAPSAVKLGLKASDYRLVNRRFRSKNIERPPISALKAVPYAQNVRGKDGTTPAARGRRKCHWCSRNANVSLSKCLCCKKRFFCSDCIKERSIDAQEVKLQCPVCRRICECKDCLPSRSKDASSQEIFKKKFKVNKHLSLHYLISLVLPILEKINVEERMELEMEAKSKGMSLSEVEIQKAEIGGKQLFCNRCSCPVLDLHRSCPNCSYSLCLLCCQECLGRKKSFPYGVNTPTQNTLTNSSMHCNGTLDNDSSAVLSSSKACSDSLCCPSLELGGCGSGLLALRRVFSLNYTTELETSAKEIISSHASPKFFGSSLHCSLCSHMAQEGAKHRELLEASRRKHPGDNYLYCPSIHDDHEMLLPHFQKHWQNSHPVIVRDVGEKASNFAWDPIHMFCIYLNMLLAGCQNNREETLGTTCTDWYEVHFNSKESFTGSLMKEGVHLRLETLKLKAKLCSTLCQKGFGDHYSEIFDALPVQEYTNPRSGLLNLASKLSEDSHEPEVSSYIYITCGNAEELQRGELVSGLCHCSHDLVNVLVHASDFPCSTDQINKIRNLIKMKHAKDMGGCNGHDIENGTTREHSKITEDAVQSDRNMERTPMSKGAGTASSCLVATEDLPVGSVRNSPTKVAGSETESDSSIMSSATNDGPQKPVVEMFHLDSNETSTAERDYSDERSSGIHWDIFRRQDTPKLQEYIQRHLNEFCNAYGSSKLVADPILDGSFFLDSAHKIKLKNEFKIEPWTFIQKLGEAVLIPAGCPYQMRNLKSCVNVVVGFVSPENAAECIKLNDQIRALPTDHKAKASRLEVEKMVISKISKAIEELRSESTKRPSSTDA